MPLKIVRNDITKMNVDAIVNTANELVTVGTGCDYAIYQAAGMKDLLAYRKEHIGEKKEGEVFITPAFNLQAKHIIHAVSPLFIDGKSGEEELLRACYQKSLQLANEHGIKSLAFPLISTGGFGYPKEEGLRIAADEINAFLMKHEMLVYIVVFGNEATRLGISLYDALESYIDEHYVEEKEAEEYDLPMMDGEMPIESSDIERVPYARRPERAPRLAGILRDRETDAYEDGAIIVPSYKVGTKKEVTKAPSYKDDDYYEFIDEGLEERLKHLSDTFSEYLVYLVESRGMEHSAVYHKAIISKKTYSKIKNNPNASPKKLTALQLCVGAKLNLDQTKDLLSRAGYALSPSDKTDVIFSFFIENEIYDMTEIDIQLEDHGLPCVIS